MFSEEREEILKLKWIESEKQCKDIGFEKALIIWIEKHKLDWAREWRNKNINNQ